MIYVRKLRVKKYKIVITDGANKQIGQFLRYVRNTLCNEQAYESLKEDYRETLHELETMAGIIAIDNNALLKKRKLRKIHFRRHRYTILYRVEEDIAYVIEIHHELEDYMTENNTKKDIIVGIAKGEELISPEFDFDKNDDEIVSLFED